jgi:hypothetical protein
VRIAPLFLNERRLAAADKSRKPSKRSSLLGNATTRRALGPHPTLAQAESGVGRRCRPRAWPHTDPPDLGAAGALTPTRSWSTERRISHTRVRVGGDALLRLPSSSRTSPRRDGSGILIDLAPVPSSAILFEKMPFMMRT